MEIPHLWQGVSIAWVNIMICLSRFPVTLLLMLYWVMAYHPDSLKGGNVNQNTPDIFWHWFPSVILSVGNVHMGCWGPLLMFGVQLCVCLSVCPSCLPSPVWLLAWYERFTYRAYMTHFTERYKISSWDKSFKLGQQLKSFKLVDF